MTDFAEFCANAQKMLENPTQEVKQEVLRLLVEEIVVSEDVITIKHIIPHDEKYRLKPCGKVHPPHSTWVGRNNKSI